MTKEIYKKILDEILEDHDGRSENYDFEYSDYLEKVKSGEWTQNHKSQYRETIYYSKRHDVYVCVNESRSGSYHSDWHYDEPDVILVHKQERVVTKTITEWLPL